MVSAGQDVTNNLCRHAITCMYAVSEAVRARLCSCVPSAPRTGAGRAPRFLAAAALTASVLCGPMLAPAASVVPAFAIANGSKRAPLPRSTCRALPALSGPCGTTLTLFPPILKVLMPCHYSPCTCHVLGIGRMAKSHDKAM